MHFYLCGFWHKDFLVVAVHEQTRGCCLLQSLVKSNKMEKMRLPFFAKNVELRIFSLKIFELFKCGDCITSLALLVVAPVFRIIAFV